MNVNVPTLKERQSFLLAAGAGDGEAVADFIARYPNFIDLHDVDSGHTPLTFAAARGRKLVIDLLLAAGVSPDGRDDRGRPAIVHASWWSRDDVVAYLLDKGAPVDSADQGGKTALMYAAEDGRTDIARVLLLKGADAYSRDFNGHSAYSIACSKKNGVMRLIDDWVNISRQIEAEKRAAEARAAEIKAEEKRQQAAIDGQQKLRSARTRRNPFGGKP